MKKLKCRRCRKVVNSADLIQKPMKNSAMTKNVCPNCGCEVFEPVKEGAA